MRMQFNARSRRAYAGFTILEILIVVAVLAVIAGMVLPALGKTQEESELQLTQASLSRLRLVIMGSNERPGYWTDVRLVPQKMSDLFSADHLPIQDRTYNKDTHFGWRGPYVQNALGRYEPGVPNASFLADYGQSGDPAVLDGWGNPIILQYPPGNLTDAAYNVRLVSAGPNGIIDTGKDNPNPTVTDRKDDLIVYLRRADTP